MWRKRLLILSLPKKRRYPCKDDERHCLQSGSGSAQGMKPLKELPLFKTYDLVKAGADKQKNCDTFFAE